MLARIVTTAVFSLALCASPTLAEDHLITNPAEGIIQLDAVAAYDEVVPDEEFSNLFASWESLDDGIIGMTDDEIIPAPRASVSIPSRTPVEGVRLSSGYGMRTHPVLGSQRHHNGVDLAGPAGTPVYATADGIVGKATYFGSYGNYVQIEHGGEMQTRYAHLSDYTVHAGEQVRKGQLIGFIGSTGRSTGPHLHYEVRIAGRPVDPQPYMTDTHLAHHDHDHGENGMGGPE